MLITNNAVRINSYLNCHSTNSDNFHTSLYCHAVKGWPVAPVQTFDLSEPLVRPHIPQEWSHNCAAACCDPRTEGQINALDRVQTKAAQFTNHTEDSDWETLDQRRTTARLCSLFKAYSGERAWKAVGDRLRRPSYLSRADHIRKIRDMKQRTDIGKYSFVNRSIKNWNQLPADVLGTFPCNHKIFR